MATTSVSPIELEDVQGLLVRGHGDMPAATFFLLGITDLSACRAWLSGIAAKVTSAAEKPDNFRLHLALTFTGLQKLGLTEAAENGFRPEFEMGMATEYKGRILGDSGESAAANWKWGGPENPEIDLLLMLYAPDDSALKSLEEQFQASFGTGGVLEVGRLDSQTNPHGREHFGFRDGVSQPLLPGLKKTSPEHQVVPVGEFILGYENAYQEMPDTVWLRPELDPADQLPVGSDGRRDFGRNGSYMVFRQLKQDVPGFWKFISETIENETAKPDVAGCTFLASKMVGRWPGGAPLTLSPEKDDLSFEEANDFTFAPDDREGFKCPVGSHIRKSNPRDVLGTNKPATALKISNRHRILRRGRNFGPPFVDSFRPEEMIGKPDDGQERGLHFICFNANIARQFEFIQHTWNDNPKFEGLYEDPDPILGITDARETDGEYAFTIQAKPIRRKVTGLKRFVHMIGGAYFFMPGIRALKFLATLNPSD